MSTMGIRLCNKAYIHDSVLAAHLATLRACTQQTRLPETVPMAMLPNDACLCKSAAKSADNAVCVVLGQVEVTREPDPYPWVALHHVNECMRIGGVVEPCTPTCTDLIHSFLMQPQCASHMLQVNRTSVEHASSRACDANHKVLLATSDTNSVPLQLFVSLLCVTAVRQRTDS